MEMLSGDVVVDDVDDDVRSHTMPSPIGTGYLATAKMIREQAGKLTKQQF